jgi:hypothetical protein
MTYWHEQLRALRSARQADPQTQATPVQYVQNARNGPNRPRTEHFEQFERGVPTSGNEDIERAAIAAEGAGSNVAMDWPALFRESLITFRAFHPEHEAHRLAWGKVINLWHMRHGERIPPHLCAGCREPMGHAAALDLMDGCRVHDDAEYECLLRYGQRWRGTAERALEAAGCWSKEHVTAQIAEFPSSRRDTGA